MSFSSDVKKELAQQCPRNRHCMIAELAGILFYTNVREPIQGEYLELIPTWTNEAAAEKYRTLLERAFDIEWTVASGSEEAAGGKPDAVQSSKTKPDIGEEQKESNTSGEKIGTKIDAGHKMSWICRISPGDCYRILGDLRLLEADQPDAVFTGQCCSEDIVRRTCCKRAFIRGAFLAAGSISDPKRSYHFEIACRSTEQAAQMRELMAEFGVEAKVVKRKTYYMLYIKESEQVVDLLNVMEAYVSLMNLENVRIVREMRGSVNRRVNCETANIQKTVDAAVRQVEDIELIRDKLGFEELSTALREMALTRLEWPEATLQELGEKLDPPVGKSGVNHRLRKLSQIAEELRANTTGSKSGEG